MTRAPARLPSHFRLSQCPRHPAGSNACPLANSGRIACPHRHHHHRHHHHHLHHHHHRHQHRHPVVSAAATSHLKTYVVAAACSAASPLPPLRHRCIYQLTRLFCVLLLLTMVGGRCLASPWIEENGDSVNLRAQFCKPVSDEHLRGMLGAGFDPSRMITEDMAAAKRADPSRSGQQTYDVDDRSAVEPYYQEDDPSSDRELEDEIVDVDGGWQEDLKDEEGELEEEVEKDLRSEAGVFRKEADMDSVSADSTDVDRAKRVDPPAAGSLSLLGYMKRRRRASSAAQPSPNGTEDSLDKLDKKNDSLLPLRLFFSGKNKKLRRKLKKVYRKKAKKLAGRPPPWQCTLDKKWLRLKEGYFPALLLDGKCTTDKCFYRLYDCVPQLYPVKILKRDPDYCNPLPSVSANTTYEQKWNIVRYYVTVGCACGNKDQKPVQPRRSRSGST